MSESGSEIVDPVQEVVADIADRLDVPEIAVVNQFDTVYGVTASDISEADGVELQSAYESDDMETIKRVLTENGLDEEDWPQLKAKALGEGEDDGPPEPSGNGNAPSASPAPAQGGDGLSEAQQQQVQQIVAQNVPGANEIVDQLEARIAGGGGGGGTPAEAEAQQGGGRDTQGEIALRIAEKWLSADDGGGQMAQLGQEVNKAAISSFIRELQKPSLGDIMERRMYERIADEEVDKFQEEMFEDDPLDELNEDDDDGWSVF